MLIPTIVLIYAVSLVIVSILAIIVKEKDLGVCGTIPILNTFLTIVIIVFAITSACGRYKQIYKEKIPFYQFLNTRLT
jgi:uncharacterized membrane protein